MLVWRGWWWGCDPEHHRARFGFCQKWLSVVHVTARLCDTAVVDTQGIKPYVKSLIQLLFWSFIKDNLSNSWCSIGHLQYLIRDSKITSSLSFSTSHSQSLHELTNPDCSRKVTREPWLIPTSLRCCCECESEWNLKELYVCSTKYRRINKAKKKNLPYPRTWIQTAALENSYLLWDVLYKWQFGGNPDHFWFYKTSVAHAAQSSQ